MPGTKGKSGGARPGPHPGRPSDEGLVAQRYGVSPPLPVLFDAIQERYGQQAADDLKAVYEAAHQRYERAYRLIQFERDLKRAEKTGPTLLFSATKIERRQRALEAPQAYIDGTIDLFDE